MVFHYFDKYVVVQNRPEIDFLEEQYNKDMGVSELVAGQYELSEEMKLFLDSAHQKKQEVIKKGKERVSLEIEKIKEIEETSYVMLMGGNSVLLDTLFRVQSDITETPEDEVRRMARENFEEKFKKINFIYANYNKLLKNLSKADSEDVIENAFGIFDATLNNFISI